MADQIEQQFQQPFLTEQQQALGQQAFETAVAPLRTEFERQTEAGIEQLARRGAFFGGLGQEAFRQQVLEPQAQLQAQIAGQIATGLGQTALEQAFAASEAAKSRQLQRELQQAGFEFQTGEQLAGREFTAEQAELERALQERLATQAQEFQAREAGLGREFAAGETLAEREARERLQTLQQQFEQQQALEQRGFAAEQAGLERGFTAEQAAIERGFTAEQAAAARQFEGVQQQLGRDFTQEEAERARLFAAEQEALGRDFAATQADLARSFDAEQAALGRTFTAQESQRQRDFGLSTQEAAQEFEAEQAALGRTFTAGEAALNRDFENAAREAGFEFTGEQADLDRQFARNSQAIELALTGNITGENVQEVLEDAFGEGVVLTTQDEADLRRVATAAGLTVDEYTQMRQAIGAGQLADVIANPEDYIESPQKARDFEIAMATMTANIQREIAGLPPITKEEVQADFPGVGEVGIEPVPTQLEADVQNFVRNNPDLLEAESRLQTFINTTQGQQFQTDIANLRRQAEAGEVSLDEANQLARGLVNRAIQIDQELRAAGGR